MSKKKTGTIAMLRVLQRYSDKTHVLSTRDMMHYLHDEFGIDLERRTMYDNMNVLESFGYKIHRYESGSLGYYLEERIFSNDEIIKINDALLQNPEVSDEERKSIIDKMLADYSIYQREEIEKNLA